MIPEKYLVKSIVRYPTAIVVGGTSRLGLELVESLLEQGSYVIVVDTFTNENISKLDNLGKNLLLSFVDYSNITYLDEEIRRLDYIFFLNHEFKDLTSSVSSHDFLTFSNYLDMSLSLALRFDSKFLLSTSIKAHQWTLSHDLNFQITKEVAQHTTYTTAEIQRYSESLCIEYFNKKKLDVRIVRLAELIGEGMDFLSQSSFAEILLQASKYQSINLKKDGLETEYLVHILDAAYGIIKAQFAQNTSGKIYTIAYEHPFTHLSIAYKIQDVNSDVKEIIFDKENDSLPSLKIYKPAPNLSTIGWLPRIPIERAIKQSLADAKLFLLEMQSSNQKNSKKLSINSKTTKLQKFFNLAKGLSPNSVEEDTNETTITKLITEKKRQEQIKAAELSLASERVRKSKKLKQFSSEEKFRYYVWEFALWLGKKFSFFKNKSPTQIAFLSGMVVAFLTLYFLVIGPIISTGRVLFLINSSVYNISDDVQKIDATQREMDYLSSSLFELKSILSKTTWIYDLLGLKGQYNIISDAANYGNEIILDLKKLLNQLNIFLTTLSSQENNLSLTLASDSYLNIKSPGTNLSTFLSELEDLSQNNKNIFMNIEDNLLNLQSLNFSTPIVGEQIAKIVDKISNFYYNHLSYADLGSVPNLLASDTEKTYAIILSDNLRPRPRVGDVSGLILVTMKNGSISSALSKSISEINFDMSEITYNDIKTINLTRFTEVTKQNIVFNDLMSDITENFENTVMRILQKSFGKKIDNVIIFSLTGLVDVAKKLTNLIEVDSVNIREVEDILKVQDTNSSLVSRNRAITIFGTKVFYETVAELLNKNLNVIQDFHKLIESGDIQILGSTYLNSKLNITTFEQLDNFDSFVSIHVSTEDPLYNSPNKIPIIATALQTEFSNNLSEKSQILIRPPSLGISSELSLCLPSLIPDAQISVKDFPSLRTTINQYENVKCVVFKIINESIVTIEYTKQNYVNNTANVDFNMLLKKLSGINHNLDIEIMLPQNYRTSIDGIVLPNSRYLFNSMLFSDKKIKINFK
jgi:UDP-glucuronate decarboxylase